MNQITRGVIVVCAFTFLCAHANASPLSTFAVQLGVGTEGIGVTLTKAVLPGTLNINLGGSTFNYGTHLNADGTEFKGHATLSAIPITLSYFPFHHGFNLNAGIVFNLNNVSGSPQANFGTYKFNNTIYPATEVGSLTGKTHFNAVAPYVGIGFGNPVSKGSRWNFVANFGVMYEGNPNLTLYSSGASSNPALAKNIKTTQTQLNNDLRLLNWWPIISFGVSYRL